MENNPIKQRIATLTEQWRQAAISLPEARMFSWVGASSVDYKMIRAFIMYHVSEESSVDDIFFCFSHPFRNEKSITHGHKIINDLGECLQAWNNDPNLVEKTGIIKWQPLSHDAKYTDEEFFVRNLNLLAEKLEIKEKDQFLVIAILPQNVESYKLYKNWLANILGSKISSKLRLMVYDTYDLKAFEDLDKQFPTAFEMLYPDLNMTGAMNQILENTKAEKKTTEERDAVNFQQLIIKLTEAIGKNDKAKIDICERQSVALAQRYNWPHMEALVYYFIHSYYAVNNQQVKAVELIDHAIKKADEAVSKRIMETDDTKYYYRVAKGNLFFLDKKFPEAAKVYKDCLCLERKNIDKQLLLGVYQMMAVSLKHSGDRKNAWNYFSEGWEMIKTEPEGFIKNNEQIKYYAKEMIDVAGNGEKGMGYYYEIFVGYWGNDWLPNMKNYTPGMNKMEVSV